MIGKTKISVIIPYYNKWPRIKYLIESLNRQNIDKELFEVIMVDDGSTIKLKSLIDTVDVKFNFQVIEQKNSGRSIARNFGFGKSKGEIIIFVDDDIILPPDFISSHYKEHIEKKDEVFVHGGIYDLVELTPYYDPETGEYFDFLDDTLNIRLNSKSILSFDKVFDNWEEFCSRKRVSRLEKLIQEVLSSEALSAIHWIGCVGGNVSFKRETYLKVGGFDENFLVWGGEDFELGYRLIKEGIKAVRSDNFVYHMTHAHRQHLEERRASEEYFFNKYGDNHIKILYDFLEKRINRKEFIERITGGGNMEEKSEKLALLGGEKYRTKEFAKWPEFDERDINGLLEVVNSGTWSRANYTSHLKFTYESKSKIGQFEKKFCEYEGTKYGTFVNSGTSALHLAFAALDLEEGSEVITTPYTFFSTVAPLYKYRLKPVFADVDENGNLDPEKIEEKITDKTKAVLIMHCAGYPCDMDKFSDLCHKHNLYLVQDCAHAVTSTYNNKPVASYGDISIFSFEASKTLNSGEGGFITTNSEELFSNIYSIHSCGRPLEGDWRSHVLMCENYRPSEFQGIIATTQFEKLPEQKNRRDFSKNYLDAALKDNPLVEPIALKENATGHGNYSYVLRIRDEFKKKLTGKRLAIYLETEGIPCNSGYTRLVYDVDYAKKFTTKEERDEFEKDCHRAKDFLKYSVWLPQTILISDKQDLDDVIGVINKICKYLKN